MSSRRLKFRFDIMGIKVPVIVKSQSRRNIRYSISRSSANMLVPANYPNDLLEKEIEKLKSWCEAQFEENPKLLNRFRVIHYHNNEFFEIYGKQFKLVIFDSDRKTAGGKLKEGRYVELKIPSGVEEYDKQRVIGQLLSRIFSDYFHPAILERVNYFNNKFFNEVITGVKLKNNQSNWGSCSTKGNINLSSRLLFAPQDVIDYVIVHELSHLKEMNHSSRFWKIVRDVMPNYLEKEEWLKTYGNTLKF